MAPLFIVLYLILVLLQLFCLLGIHDDAIGRNVSGRDALLMVFISLIPISVFISSSYYVKLLKGYNIKKKPVLSRTKRVKLFFLKLFKMKYCPRCLSMHLDDASWTRGTDLHYGGAIGCRGLRCYDCGYIQWHESLSSYKRHANSKYYKVYDDDPLYVDGVCIEPQKQLNIDLSGDIF